MIATAKRLRYFLTFGPFPLTKQESYSERLMQTPIFLIRLIELPARDLTLLSAVSAFPLEKRPEERFSTCAEFACALEFALAYGLSRREKIISLIMENSLYPEILAPARMKAPGC